MFDSSPNKFNQDNFYSFLPKKRLKLSKQGINLISNGNIATNPQNKCKNYYLKIKNYYFINIIKN